ncbi:hypothetical protein HY971_04325 [Candidatus Kaiserbacteria bacterium]|nr:hypothetical protein [Candidatus Kaiserbacteria bacterium]
MPTALRAIFLVPLCASLLFAFSTTVYAAPVDAEGDSDGNLDCPSQSFYVYVKGGAKVIDGKPNLYGKTCISLENKDVAAKGHCEGPKNCKADLCDDKPCALPPIKMEDVQKSVYGDSAPATPAPTLPPNTSGSLYEQMLLSPTPPDQPKTEPSTDSFKKILEQGKEPGVVDKLWNYVFQPTPINTDKETSQLQPTKYDDFGNVIPQTVGPQNTITNPNGTFGEPQTAEATEETPWWKAAWSATKESASNAWDAVAKEFGFGAEAAPEQIASEEKSGGQVPGFAENAALKDPNKMTDENAQVPGDQVVQVAKGPAETTKDLALNAQPTTEVIADQGTPRTADEIKKNALVPTATGIMTGYNPEKPGERSGGKGLATGGTYDPDAWEVAIRTSIGKTSGCGVGGGSICYALIESPDGKAAIVRVPDNGPLSGQGIPTSEYRVADLNQRVGEYFSGNANVNNIKLENMKVTLLSGSDYPVGPITGNNTEMPYSSRPAGSYLDQQPLQNASYYGTVSDSTNNPQVPIPQTNPLLGGSYFYGPGEASGFDNLAAYNYFNDDNTAMWAEVARTENLASDNSLSGGIVGPVDKDLVFTGPTATEITIANEHNGTVADWNAGFAAVPPTLAVEHNGTITDWNAGFAAVPPTLAAEHNGTVADWTAGFAVVPPTLATEQNGTTADWNAGFADAVYKDQAALDEATRNDVDIAANDAERIAALTEYDKRKAAEIESARKLEEARNAVDNAANDAERRTALIEYDKQKAAEAESARKLDEARNNIDIAANDAERIAALTEYDKRKAAGVESARKLEEVRNAVDNAANDDERRAALAAYDKQKAAEAESARKLEEARNAVDNAANDAERRIALEEYDKQKAAAEEAAQKKAGPKYYDAFGTEYSSPKVAEVSDKLQLKEAEIGVKLEAAKAELEKAKAERAEVPWYEKIGNFNFTNDALKTQDAVKLAQKNVESLTAEFKKADAAVTALQKSPYAEAVLNNLLTQPTKPEEIVARNQLNVNLVEYGDAVKTLDQFNRDPQAFVAGAGGDEIDSIRKGLEDKVALLNARVGEFSGAIPLSAESDRFIKQSVEAQKSFGQLTSEVFTGDTGTALKALSDKSIAFLGEAQRGFAEPGVYSGLEQTISPAGIMKGLVADPVANVLGVPTPETQGANLSKSEFEKGVSHAVDVAIVATPGIYPALKGLGMLKGAIDLPKISALDLTAAKVGGEAVDFATADSRIIAGAVGRDAAAGSGLGDAGAAASRNAAELAPQAEKEIAAARPPAPVDTVSAPRVETPPVEAAPAPKVDTSAPRVEPAPPEITPAPKSAEPAPIASASEKSWLQSKWEDLKSSFGYGEKPTTLTQAEIDARAVAQIETEAPVQLKPGAENPSGKVWNDPMLTKDEFIIDYKAVYPKTGLTDEQLAAKFDAGQRLNPETRSLKQEFTTKTPNLPEAPTPEVVAPKALEPIAAAEKPSLWERIFGKSEPPAAAETPKAAIAPETPPAPKVDAPAPRAEPTPAEITPAPKPAETPTPRAEPAPAETTPPARAAGEPAPVEPVKRGSGEVSKPNGEIAMGDEGPVALRPGAENPSGKVWNDRTLTRDEFVADYKARYPNTSLTDAQLAERYAAGQRLNPETGRLKVPETPVSVAGATPAGTPAAPAVAGTPSWLRSTASWVGDHKARSIVYGAGILTGGLALYNMVTPRTFTPANESPVPLKKDDVVPPPKAEVSPPVVRKDVVPPPVTRRDVVQTGYPDNSNSGGDNFCIKSIQPVVVIPNVKPGPGCYNNPGQNPAWRPFPPMPPAQTTPPTTTPTPTPAKPPVSPTPTSTPTTTPPVAKPYATLIANPPTVLPGRKSRLIWSSVNTSSCELFAPGNISMATSTRGSTSTLPLATTTQFTLNCSATSGATTSAQTTVTVH